MKWEGKQKEKKGKRKEEGGRRGGKWGKYGGRGEGQGKEEKEEEKEKEAFTKCASTKRHQAQTVSQDKLVKALKKWQSHKLFRDLETCSTSLSLYTLTTFYHTDKSWLSLVMK